MKNNIVKKNEHTNVGIASIVLGILGLILYFIGLFFFSFFDNILYGMVIGLILSILASVFGYIAYKRGDSYGIYGLILGGFVIIVTMIIIILTSPTSYEFEYYS